VIVGKELVKVLGLPLVGIVKSDSFSSSAVVSREQPSHSVRIYGDRSIVVFLCEMNSKFPDEVTGSIVDCIIDFAHRHKSPMLYSVEGVPKAEKITLPTGEEIELNLKQATQSSAEDEEEGSAPVQEEQSIVLDDTLLAKLTKREQLKNAKDKPQAEAKKDQAPAPESPKKEEPKKKGRAKLNQSGSSPKPKKGKGKGKDGEEEEEESDIESVAQELFGSKIHYITTNLETAKKLRGLGHIPVVDGIIPGVTGGLLSQVPLTDEDITAFMCPSSAIFPDPDAAVRVLQLLAELNPGLDLKKGWEKLAKEGEDLKKLMKSLLSGLDTTNLRKSGSVPYGMYQ